ncbi:hypothetical protein F5882DRAFT_471143 [Hyaloscypha sp. PMI_1271]|nr:hypothetical protein F5882DRAFT_471143 [Hyaloscypha sp. PMI_1271]
MELLSILNKQVELLAEEGQADLSRFFDSLESHSICHQRGSQAYRPSTVLRELGPVLQGHLDTAIDQVIKGIGHILSKHTLNNDDSMMVNGAAGLSCSVFKRLRSREWLNCH